MRLQLRATPIAFGPTDTSVYSGGAHRVSFRVFRKDVCLGGQYAVVDISLFTVEEVRKLALCYGAESPPRDVFLTISVGDESSVIHPLVNNRPSCCDDAAHDGDNEPLYRKRDKWVVGSSDGYRDAQFCPFCGAKLPEVSS